MIDYSIFVGAVVLVFTDGHSSEDVDYGGQLCCVIVLQQVEVF